MILWTPTLAVAREPIPGGWCRIAAPGSFVPVPGPEPSRPDIADAPGANIRIAVSSARNASVDRTWVKRPGPGRPRSIARLGGWARTPPRSTRRSGAGGRNGSRFRSSVHPWSEDNGQRQHLYQDPRSLAVSGGRQQPIRAARGRLVSPAPHDDRTCPGDPAHGCMAEQAKCLPNRSAMSATPRPVSMHFQANLCTCRPGPDADGLPGGT